MVNNQIKINFNNNIKHIKWFWVKDRFNKINTTLLIKN